MYEVFEDDGTPVGLYLLDPYTRDSKRGGAWMSSLVEQSELGDDLPVVVNNLNIPKPAAGEPTLLTYDETETLFHEFGHALHGLLARVRYPSQSGTNVYRDFVELPSQVNELWMLRPEVLASYAVHHETGERMPQELVDRLIAARGFNAGFETAEYLAAAVLDQAWHRVGADDDVTDVAAFERAALARRASTTRSCRRGTRARTSPTCSRAATTRATTRTSGARCRAPTSWRGSRGAAVRRARTAIATDARSSRRAARATRATRSGRSSGAIPRSGRCWLRGLA